MPRKPSHTATTAKAAARSTVSGSRKGPRGTAADVAVRKMQGTQALAAAFPFNANKRAEFADAPARRKPGATAEPPDPSVTGSTLTEANESAKAGKPARPGVNPGNGPLERVRVDSGGQALTTNFGQPIADNQNSLKAGLRGPALLEDFVLREKITHFDHERIPERIVHARGSAAHGFFECYDSLARYTRASFLSEQGKRTPVFVRFSTVAGERGSTDTPRDVRGFATKFYTDEGNFDIVGNNIPVFFIQDAMKFPDLVHALKPEPHHAMPQAASAHDTFWDFVSLMPESTHMLMWVMSDRALPRSFRTMQGFGVHTFRLVNAKGESRFVKFHWTPVAGTHSLDWDESVKISGADPDYTRRDLWESIEAGVTPEYELGLQIFSEEQANGFSFDVLDATKIVPEELVPVKPVARAATARRGRRCCGPSSRRCSRSAPCPYGPGPAPTCWAAAMGPRSPTPPPRRRRTRARPGSSPTPSANSRTANCTSTTCPRSATGRRPGTTWRSTVSSAPVWSCRPFGRAATRPSPRPSSSTWPASPPAPTRPVSAGRSPNSASTSRTRTAARPPSPTSTRP